MGNVYFLQAKVEPPLFKVGYTGSSIQTRMRAIQTTCPYELNLYASLPGTVSLEQEIHKDLEDYRTHGEWFRINPDQIDRLLMMHSATPPDRYFEVVEHGHLLGWVRISDGAIFIPLGMFSHQRQVAYFATGEILRFAESPAVYVNLREVEKDYAEDEGITNLLVEFRVLALTAAAGERLRYVESNYAEHIKPSGRRQ